MKRIAALFDIHRPFNIPLDPVLEFLKDFKPHITVIGGDAHDFPSLSTKPLFPLVSYACF